MDRRTIRAASIALLVVLAVGVAAATLNSTLSGGDSLGPGGGASGPSEGVGDEAPGDADIPSNISDQAADATAQLCLPGVQTTGFKVGYLVFWLAIGGVLFWRVSSRYLATFVFVGLTIQLAAIYTVLVGLCGRDIREEVVANATDLPDETASEIAGQLGQRGGEAGAFISSNPLLTAIIVAVAVALLVALVLLYSEEARNLVGARPSETEEPGFEEQYDAQALRMMGQAAGEAADRIDESGDADNEVYRAWREMTQHIDVERPESSTPGEFAAAAVDAGMAAEDVEALTAVFEEVRYGGLPATDEAETRAIEALRGIERSYADWEAES